MDQDRDQGFDDLETVDRMDESGLRARPNVLPRRGASLSDPPTLRGSSASVTSFPHAAGRYLVSEPIAAGGMASVHLGVASDRPHEVLAMKRLHAHLVADENFTKMLLDEANIAAHVRHPNVVATHRAEAIGEDVYLVMEYVAGLPLNALMRQAHPAAVPVRIAAKIVSDALRGLHAAHEATDARGQSLGIVHRDVSPQNILVGLDGRARVLDFGIAKASRRLQTTRAGEIKGKLPYMAPEQLLADLVDRRTDIRAAGVVLWEALTGCPLFHSDCEGSMLQRILDGCSTFPSRLRPEVPPELDAIVMRALARRPQDRFRTALEMAQAIDAVFAASPVTREEIGRYVDALGAEAMGEHAVLASDLRRRSSSPPPAPAPRPVMAAAPPREVETVRTSPRLRRELTDKLAMVALVVLAAIGGAVASRSIAAVAPAHAQAAGAHR